MEEAVLGFVLTIDRVNGGQGDGLGDHQTIVEAREDGSDAGGKWYDFDLFFLFLFLLFGFLGLH